MSQPVPLSLHRLFDYLSLRGYVRMCVCVFDCMIACIFVERDMSAEGREGDYESREVRG